jgi:antitoxin ParD1/3/4
MSTMNVSLPDEMRDFVERQVRAGSFSTSSEYIRALIRRDEARTQLRVLLHEGLESPDVGAGDSTYFAGKRKAARIAATPSR